MKENSLSVNQWTVGYNEQNAEDRSYQTELNNNNHISWTILIFINSVTYSLNYYYTCMK